MSATGKKAILRPRSVANSWLDDVGYGQPLTVARAIAKDETQASIVCFACCHVAIHSRRRPSRMAGAGSMKPCRSLRAGTEYQGRAAHRPQRPGADWRYLQMVKQRDEHGRFQGTKLRYLGTKAEVVALLGKSTAYIERSNLTSRMFNGRQVRKTLAFSKDLQAYRASATWEDSYYNLIRPHKSLRYRLKSAAKWSPRTPAMAANLTDHIWTVNQR